MAMTDKFGGGTTVKVLDLLSNKVLHEVTYPDTIGESLHFDIVSSLQHYITY